MLAAQRQRLFQRMPACVASQEGICALFPFFIEQRASDEADPPARPHQRSGNVEQPVLHRGKALQHILDTFPRDELFQSSIPDLYRTAMGILNLQDRQRVRFFLRRDAFRRFFSCLVFVPRERYATAIRRRIEAVLKDAFEGTSVDWRSRVWEAFLCSSNDAALRQKIRLQLRAMRKRAPRPCSLS